VYDSLDAWMGISACNVTDPPAAGASDAPTTAFRASGFRDGGAAGTTFFVSPTGSDRASGADEQHPFATLVKARDELRALSPSERAGAVVNLLAGTHYLSSSLVFTADDSGNIDRPVTWQAYPSGARVAVSGGVALSSCKWSAVTLPSGIAAQKCDVPPGTSFARLFIDGLRKIQARFPNGDPLVPNSGYTHGASMASMFPMTATSACATSAGSANVNYFSTAGELISTGCVPDQVEGWSLNVTVVDRNSSRGVTTEKGLFVNSSRYNSTYNLPIRAVSAPNAVHLPATWQVRLCFSLHLSASWYGASTSYLARI
jgi:hypothetical protein